MCQWLSRNVCGQAGRPALLWLQVSYALVFVLEYLGPLLIYPTFWASPIRGYVYSDDTETRQVAQDLACVYWCAHYAKV
jgi:uncharacterized protein YjeT (DUF2065 family)